MDEQDLQELHRRISESIKEELKPNKSWLRHPAVLMLLGFFLTSVLGAGLSSYMNRLEFDRKQELAYADKLLENKIKLMNEASELTGKFLTATYKVHGYYTKHYSRDAKQEILNRTKSLYDEANSEMMADKDRIRIMAELYTANEQVIENTFDSINNLTHGFNPISINLYVQSLFRIDYDSLAAKEEDGTLKEYRIIIKRKADSLKTYNNKLHTAFLQSMYNQMNTEETHWWDCIF